ncbi:MAG: type II toxin-antitoxin system RelE/ParE family toxin [Minisyncoccales bacterium]
MVITINRVKRITINGNDPIENFIDNLEKEDAAKVIDRLEMLNKYGLSLGPPYIKQLQNHELWEFRVSYRRNQYRIIFFLYNDFIVLLHGFKYKDKIPENEIKIALERKKTLLKNLND